jgi:Domain of unknown function (DUF4091)
MTTRVKRFPGIDIPTLAWVGVLALGCAAAARADEGTDTLWAVDALTKLLPDTSPPQARPPIQLEAARGETVSGQVAVRLSRAAKALRAEVSALQGSGRSIAPVRVRLQWVRRIDVKRNSEGVPLDELVAKAPCSLPDPFWDRDAIEALAGVTQPLWVEIDVPRDAAPGDYEGTLTVRHDGQPVTLPLRLKVWDFEMPTARHQQVTNWFTFPGAGSDAAWDSPAFWDLAARFAKIMVAHRQTCFKAELRWIKTTYDPATGFHCDFRMLDHWAETFFAAGMDRMELFEAGRATASVDDPAARVVPVDLLVEVTSPDVKLTAEAKLRGILEQLEKHVKEKRWTGRVMIHIADEPFLHCVPTYRQMAAVVHSAAPSLRVIEAVEATGFGDAIDVLVPKLNHLNLWLPYFEKAHAQGKELWFYTCCHPLGRYPNRFLDQPLVKARELHWIGYLYGLDGYLHWGLNYFAAGVDPYSEEGVSKDLPLGDRAVMYPGRDGPVGSLRWSALRDGLQDYEYLWVLENRLSALEKRVGAGADWLEPRQRPLELCRRVVTSFYDHTRRPDVLLAARHDIAAEIEALGRAPLLYVQTEPPEGTAVPAGLRLINVRGVVDPGATVKIDGRLTPEVQPDGTFLAACFLSGPTITVEATKSGATRKVTRTFRLVD